MKNLLIALSVSIGMVYSYQSFNPTPKEDTKPFFAPTNNPDEEERIQIALLLDCSGSMDGLIEQAKSQLWKMVNTLGATKRNGKMPKIELALYEYGKDNNPSDKGYIRQLSALSTDLDNISAMLFAMNTNGGSEYCGHVIKTCLDELEWKEGNNNLKVIIIAGNEAFDQGGVNFRESCKRAFEKGIIVNTIHCGDCETGVREFWKEGADIGKGEYLCINTNATVQHIPTPYDDDILKWNGKLNDTYYGYGSQGKYRKEMQSVQDNNAQQYGAANAATRAQTKAGGSYDNDSWDVVDAAKKDEKFAEKLSKEKEEEKPDIFKNMNEQQIKEKITQLTKEREEIQAKILDLSKKAEDFRTEERKKSATSPEANSLDAVMEKAMKKQAKEKGFE